MEQPGLRRSEVNAKRKLLIVGVDAGSPELFRKWSSTGDLPNLSRLMAAGNSRRVENPRGMEAGAVWPVFHTGLLPGRQPMYDGRRNFNPANYTERWYGPEETAPTVWRQLSDAGLRCLLIDPPYTLVDPQINGVTIMDWGTHVPANGNTFEFKTHPPEVAAEVLALVGPDPAGGVMCDVMSPESLDEYRRFRDIYLRRIEGKAKLAQHFLDSVDWDVALVTSSDLHCAGHHLWHINEPRHPRYSSKERGGARGAVARLLPRVRQEPPDDPRGRRCTHDNHAVRQPRHGTFIQWHRIARSHSAAAR